MYVQMNVLMNGGDELRGEHAREKGMNDIFLSIAVIPKLHKIVPYRGMALLVSRPGCQNKEKKKTRNEKNLIENIS